MEAQKADAKIYVNDLQTLCSKKVPFPALQERGIALIDFFGRGTDAEFV